jgi:hypothetical protein
MNPRVMPAIFLIFAGTIGLAAEPPKSGAAGDDWKFATKTNGITIYTRLHEGSSLKEFKAVGDIDAPSRAVHGVIGDIDAYPSFMPYTVECRLLKREKDSLITYQRISPKICGDRDYTLRVRQASWPGSGGLVYTNYWELANALGPPQKPGVVRVKVCEGAWLLEPDGIDKTHATYSIYTDSGGVIPSFIANHASQMAIGQVFAAVRKQVKEPKYNAAMH